MPTKNHARVLAVALCASLLATAACAAPAAKPKIRVGTKNFAEQFILGEMYALLLESAGFQVERKFNLGPTEAAQAALEAGQIDLYPEYTGTGLLNVLHEPPNSDPAAVYNTVADGYAARFNLAWLAPAPANNTQAIAMTDARAAELRVVTLSDFAERARELSAQGTPLIVLGPPEFLTRTDGLPGLQSAYGELPIDFRPVSAAERYEHLTDGTADAVVAFGTDGEVDGFELTVLIDDRRFFPPYQVAPVVRQAMLDRYPAIRAALDQAAPLLTDSLLRDMNFEATVGGVPPADIARRFLVYSGLIPGVREDLPPNIAGSYRINAVSTTEQIEGQFMLSLHPDHSAAVTWVSFVTETLQADPAIGAWSQAGNTVAITFTETAGRPITPAVTVQAVFDGHFITAVQTQNDPTGTTGYQFFLVSGDRHPAIRQLHERMAAVPWLGFADPGPSYDIYDEETRQAIVAFQVSQGLLPTGIVDAQTWTALKNPVAPSGTPEPAPAPTYAPEATPEPKGMARTARGLGRARADRPAAQVPTAAPPTVTPAPGACTPSVTIGEDATNLRQSPSTQSTVLAVLPPGAQLAAKGISTDRAWYQVAYGQTDGWVFGQLVTPTCADGLPVVDVPVPAPSPAASSGSAAPTPPPATNASGDKVIYLTYDDGPNGTWTPQLLDILIQNGARATFFQIGQQVTPFADIVRSQLAAGMGIGNHTWNHPSLAGLSQAAFNSQIQRTQDAQAALGAYSQPGPHCLRPPYGATDGNTRGWAEQLGYRVVMWTVDPQDWALPGTQQIIDHLLSHARPGAIFLSHDGGGNRSQTIDAYRVVIPQLAAQGYRFVADCQ